jgi:hypothetical protein
MEIQRVVEEPLIELAALVRVSFVDLKLFRAFFAVDSLGGALQPRGVGRYRQTGGLADLVEFTLHAESGMFPAFVRRGAATRRNASACRHTFTPGAPLPENSSNCNPSVSWGRGDYNLLKQGG